jgi:hypothetical protein
MNMDHPNQDTDPENDGYLDNCLKCGKLLDDLDKPTECLDCFYSEHGPDDDKDLDPERHGGFNPNLNPGLYPKGDYAVGDW